MCYCSRMTETGGYIYGVFDRSEPDRCRYVGLTTRTIKERSSAHWCSSRDQKRPLACWLKSRRDRREDVEFRGIDSSTSLEELRELEVLWIAELRLRGEADLNLADGGQGSPGWVMPEEMKEHLRQVFSGAGNPMYGVKRSEIAKYARSFRTFSPEARAKLGAASKAAWTPERRIAQAERARVRVREPLSLEAREAIGRARAHLTDDQVRAIREAKKTESNNQELARMFNLPYGAIRTALGFRGAYFWVK